MIAAQLRVNRGDLVRGEPRASPESHVLLRMRHSRKAGGRLIAARQVVLLHGDDGRQRIADDHHPQTIVEGSPKHGVFWRGHTPD